uniref:Uncharacterized protein n=1 Tax=Arundo donax TaxID=35708 RepID=A0A0A9F2M3_ARUDO
MVHVFKSGTHPSASISSSTLRASSNLLALQSPNTNWLYVMLSGRWPSALILCTISAASSNLPLVVSALWIPSNNSFVLNFHTFSNLLATRLTSSRSGDGPSEMRLMMSGPSF